MVAELVGVDDGVFVGVLVDVAVDVFVGVLVGVLVDVFVGVGEGDGVDALQAENARSDGWPMPVVPITVATPVTGLIVTILPVCDPTIDAVPKTKPSLRTARPSTQLASPRPVTGTLLRDAPVAGSILCSEPS